VVSGEAEQRSSKHSGVTVALATGSGCVQTAYTCEPFGVTTPSGTSSSNVVQFTGRENDGTGLYYYRERYMLQQWQRFIAEDPLDFFDGFNLHTYVANDPVNTQDPLGQWGVLLQAGGA
jgi:RHS repeat-associated protein